MMVQVMIFCFVIFAAAKMNVMLYVAMLAFGINSGAYVAEIIRAGNPGREPRPDGGGSEPGP